ncbi:MAG: NAD(P)H-dependent oxidoreductase, partial [Lachnospiraceae bacterium]|nr:NAD(P)H-dependent oxidoreductase [Lachnospiraceae bacterium]
HHKIVDVKRAEVTKVDKISTDKKGIVVYFTRVGNSTFDEDVEAVSSASLMLADGELAGNSEVLAEMICNATGYESYAIKTVKKYPSTYEETCAVARTEMLQEEDIEIEEVPDMSEYDTVIMVYPIWWSTIPEAVKVFYKNTDLEGKTLYSLVTHGGSKFGATISDTKKYTKANVSDNNLVVFDKDVVNAQEDVENWIKSMK